jgi:hypothetical protein
MQKRRYNILSVQSFGRSHCITKMLYRNHYAGHCLLAQQCMNMLSQYSLCMSGTTAFLLKMSSCLHRYMLYRRMSGLMQDTHPLNLQMQSGICTVLLNISGRKSNLHLLYNPDGILLQSSMSLWLSSFVSCMKGRLQQNMFPRHHMNILSLQQHHCLLSKY